MSVNKKMNLQMSKDIKTNKQKKWHWIDKNKNAKKTNPNETRSFLLVAVCQFDN